MESLKITQHQVGLDLTFTIYRDEAKEWRWRLRSNGNGRTLAASGEGYKRKSTCVKMVMTLRTRMASSTVRSMDARTGIYTKLAGSR